MSTAVEFFQAKDFEEGRAKSGRGPGVHVRIHSGRHQQKVQLHVSHPVDDIAAACFAEVDDVDCDASGQVTDDIPAENDTEHFGDAHFVLDCVRVRAITRGAHQRRVCHVQACSLPPQREVDAQKRERENAEREYHNDICKHEAIEEITDEEVQTAHRARQYPYRNTSDRHPFLRLVHPVADRMYYGEVAIHRHGSHAENRGRASYQVCHVLDLDAESRQADVVAFV